MCQESLGFLSPFFLAVALSCTLTGAQGQALTASQLQQIKQACETLVLDYANHRDQSRGERLAQLFTEDAELLVNGQTFVGREALRNLGLALRDVEYTTTDYVWAFDRWRREEAEMKAKVDAMIEAVTKNAPKKEE